MNRRTISIVVGGVLVAGAAFAGGYYLASKTAGVANPRAAFARLTQADRDSMAAMSDEERQSFLAEKGIDMPGGAPGMGAPSGSRIAAPGRGSAPGDGTQMLEGSVESVEGDKMTLSLTAGGSAKVYTDDSTIVASVSGKAARIAEDVEVLVMAHPEAAGVTSADALIVK